MFDIDPKARDVGLTFKIARYKEQGSFFLYSFMNDIYYYYNFPAVIFTKN